MEAQHDRITGNKATRPSPEPSTTHHGEPRPTRAKDPERLGSGSGAHAGPWTHSPEREPSVEHLGVAEDVGAGLIPANAVVHQEQQRRRRAPDGHVALDVTALHTVEAVVGVDGPFALGVGAVEVDRATEVDAVALANQEGASRVRSSSTPSAPSSASIGAPAPTASSASQRCTAVSTAMRRGQKEAAGSAPTKFQAGAWGSRPARVSSSVVGGLLNQVSRSWAPGGRLREGPWVAAGGPPAVEARVAQRWTRPR